MESPIYRSLTDMEAAVLSRLGESIQPLLSAAANTFMNTGIASGLNPQIVAAAYVASLCSSLANITAVASGAPNDIFTTSRSDLIDVGYNAQYLIAEQVQALLDKLANQNKERN